VSLASLTSPLCEPVIVGVVMYSLFKNYSKAVASAIYSSGFTSENEHMFRWRLGV
jgi:hypothetical protein